MRVNSLFLSTLLLSLLLYVYAAPLQDVSVTSVDLSEESINTNGKGSNGDEHLFVTVTRVDDLIDDDGTILAERVMAVRVTFDVVENQVRCNGVPIEIGVSNIQVQVQMATDPTKLTMSSPEEVALLEDSFDVGLATVQVTATLMDEMVTPDGITFRRIAVQEKITEINNQKVVQTDAGQQVLDIFENGHLNKYTVDPLTGFLLPDEQQLNDEATLLQEAIENENDDYMNASPPPFLSSNTNDTRQGCAALLDPLVQWWNQQSTVVRGTITGAISALLFGLALFIRHLILSANRAYEALPIASYEDDDDDEDNHAKLNDEIIYQQSPPAYQHDEKQPFLKESA
ncbi:unnamed protein product [Cunninghamella echinulata]